MVLIHVYYKRNLPDAMLESLQREKLWPIFHPLFPHNHFDIKGFPLTDPSDSMTNDVTIWIWGPPPKAEDEMSFNLGLSKVIGQIVPCPRYGYINFIPINLIHMGVGDIG